MAAIIFFMNKVLKREKQFKKIKIGRTSKTNVKWVSEEQYMNMLEVTEEIRDKLVQKTFWFTGIRNAEASNLLLKDIDFKECKGYVREGKGGNPRKFDLDLELVDEL